MKYTSAAWSIIFLFNSFLACTTPPTSAVTKVQAQKIICAHQPLRKLAKGIIDKPARKNFKSQLDEILRHCNIAYTTDNEEYARTLLKKAEKLLEQAKHDPILTTLRAAL